MFDDAIVTAPHAIGGNNCFLDLAPQRRRKPVTDSGAAY
jgi:hypothetical protein